MHLYIIGFLGFIAGAIVTALYLTSVKKMVAAGIADVAAKLEKVKL